METRQGRATSVPKKQDEGACHARRYTRTTRPPRSCQVVGDTTVVAAFLRVVKDKDKPKKPQERFYWFQAVMRKFKFCGCMSIEAHQVHDLINFYVVCIWLIHPRGTFIDRQFSRNPTNKLHAAKCSGKVKGHQEGAMQAKRISWSVYHQRSSNIALTARHGYLSTIPQWMAFDHESQHSLRS